MFDWIEAQPDLGRIDICIANAGLSTPESLLDGKNGQKSHVVFINLLTTVQFTGNMADWRRMLEVNVVALAYCTQRSVKNMQKVRINSPSSVQNSAVFSLVFFLFQNRIDDGQIIFIRVARSSIFYAFFQKLA